MNLLIDSHALLWWFSRRGQLSTNGRKALESSDNRVYVSAAVAWELAIKAGSGKLEARPLISDLRRLVFEEGFRKPAISMEHAIRAGNLPHHHKDPFDRMLVAQSQALSFPIVSADAMFDHYGVERIW